MKGMLAPKFQEVLWATPRSARSTRSPSVGTVCRLLRDRRQDHPHSKVRVVRDGIVIYEGELASLQRFKDDVKEVAEGYECGMQVEKYNDIKVGDVIEVYVMEEIKQ